MGKWKLRLAALPLIAAFTNMALPTQAALPELGPAERALAIQASPEIVPVSSAIRPLDISARFAAPSHALNEDGKSGRWWAVERAAWSPDATESASDPASAILRGFTAVAPERLAGVPAQSDPFAEVRDEAAAIAYAPYEARKVVWSPLAYYTMPPARDDDHDWMRKPLPNHVFAADQQQCLAKAIYFEARGESEKGQAAVGQVILNRVRNPAYPNTICGVVYQNAEQRNRCQFSFACDGKKERISQPSVYTRASKIAMAVTSGELYVGEIGSSTHYFANYVRPVWARSMVKMASIGDHHFFRTRSGGWR